MTPNGPRKISMIDVLHRLLTKVIARINEISDSSNYSYIFMYRQYSVLYIEGPLTLWVSYITRSNDFEAIFEVALCDLSP